MRSCSPWPALQGCMSPCKGRRSHGHLLARRGVEGNLPRLLRHFVFPQERARFWLCHRQLPDPQCPRPTATSAAKTSSSSQSRTPAPSQNLALPSRPRETHSAGVRTQGVWTPMLASQGCVVTVHSLRVSQTASRGHHNGPPSPPALTLATVPPQHT